MYYSDKVKSFCQILLLIIRRRGRLGLTAIIYCNFRSMDMNEQPKTTVPIKKNKNHKKWLIPLVVALLVIGVAIAGLTAYTSNYDKSFPIFMWEIPLLRERTIIRFWHFLMKPIQIRKSRVQLYL